MSRPPHIKLRLGKSHRFRPDFQTSAAMSFGLQTRPQEQEAEMSSVCQATAKHPLRCRQACLLETGVSGVPGAPIGAQHGVWPGLPHPCPPAIVMLLSKHFGSAQNSLTRGPWPSPTRLFPWPGVMGLSWAVSAVCLMPSWADRGPSWAILGLLE